MRRQVGTSSPRTPRPPYAAIGITLVALAVIAIATLRRGDLTATGAAVDCFLCVPSGSRAAADLVLNVFLFVPLGVGLGALRLGWGPGLTLIAVTTLIIELLQGGIIAGRYSSAGDLLTNTLGGALGILIALRSRTLLYPPRATASVLAFTAVAAWLCLIAASSIASTPSFPFAPSVVRWRPAAANNAPGEGRILSARIDGVPLPSSPRPTDDPRLDGLRLGETTRIEVTLLPSPSADGRDVRVEIGTEERPARIWIGQNGPDLVLRTRLRTADLRLRYPTLRVSDALVSLSPSPAGDTVAVVGIIARHRLRLETSVAGLASSIDLPLGPHLGWSFLVPGRMGLGASARAIADAIWLAGLLLPAAYWSRRATGSGDPSRREGWNWLVALGVGASILLAGFTVVPTLLGVASAPLTAWGMAIAFLLGGWGIGRASLGAPIFGFSTLRRKLRWMSGRVPP